MKIRSGFVSNSSSSSFIVYFKEVPKSKEELKKLLFGDRTEYHYPYGTEFFPTDVVADVVWKDMQEGPADTEKVKNEIRSGYPTATEWAINNGLMKDMPNISDYETKPGKKFSERFDSDAYDKALKEYYSQFDFWVREEEIDQGKCFVFEYSDNDGTMRCAMEHGNLFENGVDSYKISKH